MIELLLGVGVILAVAVGVYFLFFGKDISMNLYAVAAPVATSAAKGAVDDSITAVVMTFKRIELQPEGGKRVIFEELKVIDFMSLDENMSSLFLGKEVPAGKYEWIRLIMGQGSYVEKDGVKKALSIPSGLTTGLKLIQGFKMPAGEEANFAIIFDIDKSLKEAKDGNYTMRPTLKLVDNYVPGELIVTDEPEIV